MNPMQELFAKARESGRNVTAKHTITNGEYRVRELAVVESVHPKHVVLLLDGGAYRSVRYDSIEHMVVH